MTDGSIKEGDDGVTGLNHLELQELNMMDTAELMEQAVPAAAALAPAHSKSQSRGKKARIMRQI